MNSKITEYIAPENQMVEDIMGLIKDQRIII